MPFSYSRNRLGIKVCVSHQMKPILIGVKYALWLIVV